MTATMVFDPWHFLSAPLDELLTQCRVRGVYSVDGAGGFLAGINDVPDGRLDVEVAPCDSDTERDAVLRGILAAWFGVDTADWPVAMQLTAKARR